MKLQTTYGKFLASPDISFLAQDVSMHHITTLTTTRGPSAVLKHFDSADVKIKGQRFIDFVVGPMSLAVIVDTTLEFVTGGGPYLLNLDDHFFVQHPVTLPITHFVYFNSHAEIRQIRLSWDQGSLLKLMNVIGKTGRNWPIFDVYDQSKLVASCVEKMADLQIHDEVEARQAPDSHQKIFDSSHSSHANEASEISAEKSYNPTRFKHFEFADGAPNEGSKSARMSIKKDRHEGHWEFDDFMTPQKSIPSKLIRTNDVRHWENGNDKILDGTERIKKSDKPRRDAKTHFTLQDADPDTDGHGSIRNRFRGHAQKNSQSLYRDLFDEENGTLTESQKPSLPHLTNFQDRCKDFEAHFTMSDKSPGNTPREVASPDGAKRFEIIESNEGSSENTFRKDNHSNSKSRRYHDDLESNIGNSRQAKNNTSNRQDGHKGIRTGGDGMGGRKGTGRLWGFGDDSDGEEEGGVNKPGKYCTGKQAGKVKNTGGDF